MRGFVLAGGLGTRLAPYTTVLPKPLLPLGRSTILETLLGNLATSGMTDVTVSLGYLGHLVRAVIGDGDSLGLSVSYTQEAYPLGTAGALGLMENLNADDVVISVNGDTLTDFDFRTVGDHLQASGSDAVIVVKERTTAIDFGVVEFGSTGKLEGYVEKPVLTHMVSTGIVALRGESVLRWLPPGKCDMPQFLSMVQAGGGSVACLPTSAMWLDLGRPEDLEAANQRLRAE